jgi:hypothetical protein
MSYAQGMDLSLRWRSKSVVVERWLTEGKITPGGPICEVRADGELVTIFDTKLQPADLGGVVGAYVRVGKEVGPAGYLLEIHSHGGHGTHPEQARLQPLGRTRLVAREKYPSVFLNYRRADAEAHTGRLHEVLQRRYGDEQVFMDQFSIRPGEVSAWTMQQAVARCDVMVSVIGPNWLTIEDKRGAKKLEDKWDFVRREICAALDRSIPIVPLLVGGAQVLTHDAGLYHYELQGLEQLQFHHVTTKHWSADVEAVIEEIDRQLAAG